MGAEVSTTPYVRLGPRLCWRFAIVRQHWHIATGAQVDIALTGDESENNRLRDRNAG